MASEVGNESRIASDISNDLRLMTLALKRAPAAPTNPTCEEKILRTVVEAEAEPTLGANA